MAQLKGQELKKSNVRALSTQSALLKGLFPQHASGREGVQQLWLKAEASLECRVQRAYAGN